MGETSWIQEFRVDPMVLRGILAIDRERVAARPLLDELHAGLRKWGELTRKEKRLLEGVSFIEHLLDRSFELRYTDPEGMVRLAEEARLIAEKVNPRRYGQKVLADLRARTCADLGNAYRIAEDWRAARAAFAEAANWIRLGTGSRLLLARVEEFAAHLYSDLRRFPEAIEMLDRAISYYSTHGNAQEVGRALISRGLITGYGNEPELAIVFLVRGLRFIGPEEGGPALRLAAVHALALNLVEAGDCASARKLLQQNEKLYRVTGKLNQLRFYWLQGKIAYGLGELDHAEARFHVARLGFKQVGQDYDAALVSLDLALLYATEKRRLATVWLVDDMLETFRSRGIAREAIASLLLLRQASEDRVVP